MRGLCDRFYSNPRFSLSASSLASVASYDLHMLSQSFLVPKRIGIYEVGDAGDNVIIYTKKACEGE